MVNLIFISKILRSRNQGTQWPNASNGIKKWYAERYMMKRMESSRLIKKYLKVDIR